MATARKRQALSTETKFVGPAQQPFDSFMDLAKFSLDSNCPNWRNYEHPQSYVVPPLFYYKHADKSDEIFEGAKEELAALALEKGAGSKSGHQDFRFVIDRGSDEAEHIVYKAIEQLIHENVRAPFIAIQNLDMDKTKHFLKDVFPAVKFRKLQSDLENTFKEQLINFYPNLETFDVQQIQADFSGELTRILTDSSGLRCFSVNIKSVLQDILKRHELPSSVDIQRFQTPSKRLMQKINDLLSRKESQLSVVDSIENSLAKTLGDHFREYDFVIIGWDVGIVVIEVKHAQFTEKRDFSKGWNRLPDRYLEGLKQLKSFDKMISLLEECTGVEISKQAIRKILFTPNLERERFDKWYETLEQTSKDSVSAFLDYAHQLWFAEDVANSKKYSDQPMLYENLKLQLLNSTQNQRLPFDSFEAYTSILVGLASVVGFPNCRNYTMDYLKVAECQAISKEANRVETQDPAEVLAANMSHWNTAPSKRQKAASAADLDTIELQKIIILTPEQKAALEGPNRQFLVGPAGVGKTIILQAKALEMLKEGKSVFVFCPPWFAPKYKELFDHNGFADYSIESNWADLVKGIDLSRVIDGVEDVDLAAREYVMDQLKDTALTEQLKGAKFMKVLPNYDGIFIDDMMDRYVWSRAIDEPFTYESGFISRTADICRSLILMALAEKQTPAKTIWVAFDFWTDHEHYIWGEDCTKAQRLINKFLNSETECSTEVDNNYTITKLTRVMRCSENVFQAAFGFGGNFGPVVKPQLGHKIQGKRSIIKFSCNSTEEGKELCWERIKKILNELSAKNISFDNVCLILGWTIFEWAQTYFFKKCEEDGLPACILLKYTPLDFWAVGHTTSVGKCSPDKGILRIYGPDQVSSSEWPVVIFVDYRDLGRLFQDPVVIYRNYRGRSRATLELIEITAIETPDIPKRQRRLSDSFGTLDSYTTARSEFEKSEWKQLRNMAGSVALLAREALWLQMVYSQHKEYRHALQYRTRRRHYSVSEIDLDKKAKLHPTELKNLREIGVPRMW